jgi:hypothetical protein
MMAYKMVESASGHSDSLALFQLPPTDTAIEKREWIEFRSVSQLNSDSTLEFNIPGSSMNYIDLKESRLHLKVRILKEDGHPIVPQDKVALANLPLHAFWRQVDVSIQQRIISSVGTHYPYKAYIDLLLEPEVGRKLRYYQGQLFFKDEAGTFEDLDTLTGTNSGLLLRNELTMDSQTVDIEGGLSVDIMQQDRFLLNGMQIQIKLWPSESAFRLKCGGENPKYRVELVDALFKVCTIKTSPGIILGHAEALKQSPAFYPFVRSDIKSFSVPASQYSFSVDDIFQGNIPMEVIVGIVSSEGFNGNYKKAYNEFKDYNCSFAGFYVDGQSVPQKPFEPNFANKNVVEPYLALFENEEDGIINRRDVSGGYSLYRFRINQQSPALSLVRKGLTRLELKFNRPLPETCVILIYGKFQALLEVDIARNVQVK